MTTVNPRIGMVLSATVVLFSPASHADATADASSLQSGARDAITKQFGPFKLTAGPNNSGEFAVNLDGKGEKDAPLNDIQLVEHQDKFWLPAFYNIGYSADGTWTGDAHTARNATASLKPGIDAGLFHGAYEAGTPATNCAPHAAQCGTYSVFPSYWIGVGTYGDLQYRYGTISQGTGLTAVNQFNVGGGVFVVIPRTPESSLVSIDSAPRISATYYHPVDTTGGTLPLPSGIKANTLQTEFHTELGLLAKGTLHSAAEEYPFKLDIVYDGTKPTTGTQMGWESLWKVQLYTNIWKLGGTSPAITYQSGKQAGFTYDHQIIVGLLGKFLTPGSSR